MAVDWRIGIGSVNPLEALQAFGTAQQMAVKQQELAIRQQEMARKQQLQQDLTGAYNAQTGAIDSVRARTAYVNAGDVSGAMEFDQGQAKLQADKLKAYQQVNQQAIQMLGGVRDQQTYEMALRAAAPLYQQFGVDIAQLGLPDTYSPETVQALRLRALDTDKQLSVELADRKYQRSIEEDERDYRESKRRADVDDARAARAEARAARSEGRAAVRFKERGLDRAALAASGGIRSDLSDLDY